MKICWFGIYDSDYSRNSTLISGLIKNGVEVVECNAYKTGSFKYIKLVKKLLSLRREYDLIYCAFPMNYSVILAKIFGRKPIVVDAFFPMYEAYVKDRGLHSPFNLKSWVYYLLDRVNVYLANIVIADTEQHKNYWLSLNKKANVEVIYVGANTKEFFPIENTKHGDKFLVTFHGSYTPLQGVDKIVEAADILRNDKKIKFRFIGRGQLYEKTVKKIKDLKLNIELLPWLPIKELNLKLNESDVVLGIFGDTDKTDRVIPNKLFQGVAVKKPVITKDTMAVREIFTDNEVLFANYPTEIADAIITINMNIIKSDDISTKAYDRFIKSYTEEKLGAKLKNVTSDLSKNTQKEQIHL